MVLVRPLVCLTRTCVGECVGECVCVCVRVCVCVCVWGGRVTLVLDVWLRRLCVFVVGVRCRCVRWCGVWLELSLCVHWWGVWPVCV